MFFWVFLFFCSFFHSSIKAEKIEYGGIYFECDYYCGIPKYDHKAQEISKMLRVLISEIFKYKWGLLDKSEKWVEFNPYQYSGYDDDYISGLIIDRYPWEITNGIYEQIDPSNMYEDNCLFIDFNYSDIKRAFSFFNTDLFFYKAARIKNLRTRNVTHHENLLEIKKLEQNNEIFKAVKYDSATDRVIGQDNWECFYAPHEPLNNGNTYTRQRSYAKKYEEEEIKKNENEIEILASDKDSKIIESSQQKIDELLREIFSYCLKKHQPEGIEFQGTIEALLIGDYLEAIDHLYKLLSIAEKNQFNSEIISKIQFLKGQLEAECCLYGQAILSLTDAISKNPTLKEAYLERAIAHFELGDFDLSLDDYLESGIKHSTVNSIDLIPFSLGLTKGILKGGTQAGVDFIPSLLSSLRGMGLGLWAFSQDPIQISSEFVQAAKACIEFLKNHTPGQTLQELAPKLKELVKKWDQFEDEERGEITGQVIGKYGVEIFAGAGLAKGIKVYRDLKKADCLLTFETMAFSKKKKNFIKTEISRKLAARNEILKQANLKVQWDKQGKHLLDHQNYLRGRSILDHKNPQELVYKFAGTGIKDTKQIPGSPGYKEIVNFGEFIGYHVEISTGHKTPTTWGKIHYATNGVHIVPTYPRETFLKK